MAATQQDTCRIQVVTNGSKALEIARDDAREGRLRRLSAHASEPEDIPVLFATTKTEVEDETRGFDVGAVDYLTEPISPPAVLAQVRTHLALA